MQRKAAFFSVLTALWRGRSGGWGIVPMPSLDTTVQGLSG
jgi:hypothetical protein